MEVDKDADRRRHLRDLANHGAGEAADILSAYEVNTKEVGASRTQRNGRQNLIASLAPPLAQLACSTPLKGREGRIRPCRADAALHWHEVVTY